MGVETFETFETAEGLSGMIHPMTRAGQFAGLLQTNREEFFVD